MIKKLLFCILLFSTVVAMAQNDQLSNWQSRVVAVQGDSLRIDSLTISPESIEIIDLTTATTLDTSFFYIKNNAVFFKKGKRPSGQVQLSYRTLPFQLDKQANNLDTTLIRRKSDGTYIGVDFSPFKEERGLLEMKGLHYDGSFARGISFGNNQSLVLNSSFNLRLAGTLGDDIEILAAISDENIPLQPEGNTQQLQEFDKIFIQLKRKNHQLIAGDYELQRPNSYFMNYFKKLQGATYSNESEYKDGMLRSQISAAVARGKYTRNNIVVQEGNQGPYRLEGAEGERFIIIQSGTEKVYIDGKLMVRGLENDYVIDYNRGDITFTNRRLITKDSRVVIDFEYADQNYTRSMTALGTEYTNEKLRLHFNYFSEQDSKTSSGVNELTLAQKQFIADRGDQLNNELFPGVDTLEGGFDPDRIMYAQYDTTTFGVTFENIIVFSTNPEVAFFVARFTEVGQGNGDYILDETNAANGRVYKWVAPDSLTGMKQGRFVPEIRLVAPQKQQMMTLGADYQISKNSSIQTEIALTDNDLNRFSDLDSDDDQGVSLFTNFKNEKKLGKDSSAWVLQTDLKYEMVSENFNALNPYRPAEFTRDWNLSKNQNSSAVVLDNRTEHIGTAGFTLLKNKTSLEYVFSGFIRDSVYTGSKHFSRLKYNDKGFNVYAEGNLLNTESLEETTTFFRPKVDISKTFKKLDDWKLGVYGEREKNDRTLIGEDTLASNSFFYDRYEVYVESPRKEKFDIGAKFATRLDYAPVQADFLQNTTATEVNVNGNWRPKKLSNLSWNMTYRELEINDANLTNQEPQETYLGRIDFRSPLLKDLIFSTTSYTIGSGQERKVEFTYLQVNPGEGLYQWIDYNGDSTQQINEFEIAINNDQRNYTRVSVFTDDFIRTNDVLFNQSIFLNKNYLRSKWFRGEKGLKHYISRFSTKSSFQINRKTRDSPNVSQWNPLQLDIPDSSLVSLSSTINNTLFYNTPESKFRFQLISFQTNNRLVLTTGFENRTIDRLSFNMFWNVVKPFDIEFLAEKGKRSYNSEFFNERDYAIDFISVRPKLTYRITKNFRTALSYEFLDSKNNLLGSNGETAVNHDISFEAKYRRTAKTTFLLSGSFVEVAFDGDTNTPVAFAMLQGLQNGKNYLWSFVFERRLAQNIDLRLSYEGRKTGEARTVHIGRAQVRATF